MPQPGVFTLELDTAPPEVVVPATPAISRNDAYSIPYAIDEDGILWAQFVDAADTVWSFTVGLNTLSYLFSNDVAIGMGELEIYAEDDVGNGRLYTIPIAVQQGVQMSFADDAAVDTALASIASVVGTLSSSASSKGALATSESVHAVEIVGPQSIVAVQDDGTPVRARLTETGTVGIQLVDDGPFVIMELTDSPVE